MSRPFRLLQWASAVALLVNAGIASAIPMTYNVQLFNSPAGNVLQGSGFFTIDTAGQEGGAGGCDNTGGTDCVSNFAFSLVPALGGESWSFPDKYFVQFIADASGLITDYVFATINAGSEQLVMVDAPTQGGALGFFWVAQGPNLNASCDGQGGNCVVTTVPEPTTLALLGSSLFGFGWKRRKRA